MIGRALVLLAALSGPALAETITVRSGEHDGFDRLVFTFAEGTSWELGRTGSGYGLRFGGDQTITPDGVFRRMGRDRLTDLAIVDGGVDLVLGCDCYADAFLYRPNALVVDIVSGAADPSSEFEVPLAGTSVPVAPRPAPVVPDPRAAVLPVVLQRQLPPGAAPLPEILLLGQDPAAADPAPSAGARDSDEALAETEARLFESLAEAAAAGLLELDPHVAGPRQPEPGAIAAPPAPPPSKPQGPGVAARTGMGTAVPGQAAAVPAFCPPEDQFEVGAWMEPDESFDAGLARARGNLADDYGHPTAEGVLGLARFYVASGLGREALVTLALTDERLPERETLSAMARLLDDRPDGPSFPFAAPGCPGPAQLWAMLIRGTAEGVGSTDIAAAQTAFLLLPESLNALLGPQLTRLLTESGHPLAADAIFSDVTRSSDVPQAEAALAEAELRLAQAGPVAAVESLSATAADSQRLSPESMIQLIELSLRGGIPVADETLALAATLRFEQRGTEAAGTLAAAEIRARIAADRFAEAFALIEETRDDLGRLDPTMATNLWAETMTAFARRADDDAFLDTAFRPVVQDAPAPIRQLFAERLDGMGFEERADELRQDRIAPLEAPVAPAAAPHEGAATSHAEAAPAASGTLAEAAGHDAAGEGEAPPPASVEEVSTSLQTAGPVEVPSADAPVEAATPLAARERLLTETEATRAMIQALLDEHPSPADEAHD